MVDHTRLKSKASDDILSIPLDRIGFTIDTKAVLFSKKIWVDGKPRRKFETLGDLLSVKEDGLYQYLRGFNITTEQRDEIVQDVNEKLARCGFKFSDSEFESIDIRLSSLGISREAVSILKKNKITKVGDIVVLSSGKISNLVDKQNANAICKILANLGYSIKNSGARVNSPRKIFYSKNIEFLNAENREKLENSESLQEKDTIKINMVGWTLDQIREKLATMSKEDILKIDIGSFVLATKVKSRLKDDSILTIGDFFVALNKDRTSIGHTYSYVYHKLLEVLPEEVKSEANKLASAQMLGENAPAQFDFETLSEEERQKVLETPLSKFAFSKSIVEKFGDRCITVGDFLKMPKWELYKDDVERGDREQVAYVLKTYNMKWLGSLKTRPSILTNEDNLLDVNVENMNEEEKNAFMQKPLGEIGFGEKLVRLMGQRNIRTVDDLVKRTSADLRLSKLYIERTRGVLKHYGLHLTPIRQYAATKDQLPIADVRKLADEEKEKYYSSDVERIGLPKEIVDKLNEQQIHKVSDLTGISYQKLYVMLQYKDARKVRERLWKYGMDFIAPTPEETRAADLLKIHEGFLFERKNAPRFICDVDEKPFELLSDEEKEKFMKTPLSQIGISLHNANELKMKGVLTIEDAIEQSYKLQKSTRESFKEFLSRYGLKMKIPTFVAKPVEPKKPARKTPQAPRVPRVPREKAFFNAVMTLPTPVKHFDEMNDEEKITFLSLNIEEIRGLPPLAIERLHKYGVHTMKDVLLKTNIALLKKRVFTPSIAPAMDSFENLMNEYGIGLKAVEKPLLSVENDWNNGHVVQKRGRATHLNYDDVQVSMKIEPKKFWEMSKEEQDALLNYKISDVSGLDATMLEHFDDLGIKTIQDYLSSAQSIISRRVFYTQRKVVHERFNNLLKDNYGIIAKKIATPDKEPIRVTAENILLTRIMPDKEPQRKVEPAKIKVENHFEPEVKQDIAPEQPEKKTEKPEGEGETQKPKRKVLRTRGLDYSTIKLSIDLPLKPASEMSEQDKQELLDYKIEDVHGLTPNILDKLEEKNVRTIADFLRRDVFADRHRIFANRQYPLFVQLNQMLADRGLKVWDDLRWSPNSVKNDLLDVQLKINLPKKNFHEMSKEEQIALLSYKIDQIENFNPHIAENLKRHNVETILDFLAEPKQTYFSYVFDNKKIVVYHRIREELEKYGINLSARTTTREFAFIKSNYDKFMQDSIGSIDVYSLKSEEDKVKKLSLNLELKSIEDMTSEERTALYNYRLRDINNMDLELANRLETRHNIKTLGDILEGDKVAIRSRFSTKYDSYYRQIRDLLDECGIPLSSYSQFKRHNGKIYDVSSSSCGYLDVIAKYRIESERKPRGRLDEYALNVEVKDFKDMSEEEQKKLLSYPISEIFSIAPQTVRTLKGKNIRTLGDIVAMTKAEFTDAVLSNYRTQKKFWDLMEKYGLEFKEKVKEPSIGIELEPKSIYEMSEEEREKLLNTPLTNFDLKNKGENNLARKNIFTVGDLIKQPKWLMKYFINIESIAEIENALKKYDVYLITARGGKFKFIDGSTPEKDEFLQKKLCSTNIPTHYVFTLKEKGIETFDDLLKLSSEEIKSTLDCSNFFVCRLNDLMNVHYPEAKFRVRTMAELKGAQPCDFETLDEQKKQEYLDLPLEDFGVKGIYLTRCRENGIMTLADFIEACESKNYGQVTSNDVWVIKKQLKDTYNINIPKRKKHEEDQGHGYISIPSLERFLEKAGVSVLYRVKRECFKEGSADLDEIYDILDDYFEERVEDLMLIHEPERFTQEYARINESKAKAEAIISFMQTDMEQLNSMEDEPKKIELVGALSPKLRRTFNKHLRGESAKMIVGGERVKPYNARRDNDEFDVDFENI